MAAAELTRGACGASGGFISRSSRSWLTGKERGGPGLARRGIELSVPRERDAPPRLPRRSPTEAAMTPRPPRRRHREPHPGAPQRYATPEGRLALGRFLLLRGADAKGARPVLRRRHRAASPTSSRPTSPRPSWPSTSRTRPRGRDAPEGPPKAAEDPRFHYLLARAFADDDRAQSAKALAEALEINPHHVDSLLLQADHLIDAEKYADAEKVLAGARGQPASRGPGPTGPCWPTCAATGEAEAAARDPPSRPGPGTPRSTPDRPQARRRSTASPRGPRTSGRRWSSIPTTCPPRCSSARTCCGWARRRRAGSSPTRSSPGRLQRRRLQPVTLRDHLAKFRTLAGRRVPRADGRARSRPLRPARAGPAEAGEGDAVREVRREAAEPVIVEIFPRQKDFAVRTFGLPGADGFLGVCFGRVITANSPASQGETRRTGRRCCGTSSATWSR